MADYNSKISNLENYLSHFPSGIVGINQEFEFIHGEQKIAYDIGLPTENHTSIEDKLGS